MGFRVTTDDVEEEDSADDTLLPRDDPLSASFPLMPDKRAEAALFSLGATIGGARLARRDEDRDARLWPGVLLKSIGFLVFTAASASDDGAVFVRTEAARFSRGAIVGA
jgi:hypothetical protein